jgi:hypothetical protein
LRGGGKLEDGLGWWFELLEQVGDAEGPGVIGAKIGVLPVGVDGLGSGAGLVGDDGEVEPGGGELGVLPEGVGEALPGFAVPAPLLEGNTQAVESLGVARGKFQNAAEAAIGQVPLPQPQLGLSQPEPAFLGLGGEADMGAEGVEGAVGVAIFEPETAEVEMGDGEIAVDPEGLAVGVGCFAGLAGGVVGEAEVVPGLGIAGEEFDGRSEPWDGVLRPAFLEQSFPVEQGPGAGGCAGGEQGCQSEGGDGQAGAPIRVSGRQHSISRYDGRPGLPRATGGNRRVMPRVILTLLLLCQSFCLRAEKVGFAEPGLPGTTDGKTRIVIVRNPEATRSLSAVPQAVNAMVAKGIVAVTGKSTASEGWRGLVSTQDVVGIKVYSVPGPSSGTRPAVVEAVVRGLIEAGHPGSRIVIWDRRLSELRAAGFVDLADSLGVRAAGAVEAGFDPAVAYENSVLGQLVFGDLEFERTPGSSGETNKVVGRRSHLSRLLTQDITRHIVIAPMLNHNFAGVSGILYSVASGATDNFIRFETNPALLLSAVPEIFGQPVIADHVAIHIVDALIGQYEGSKLGLLQYSSTLNELRFSTDPVALDLLSLNDLNRLRVAAGVRGMTNGLPLFENARLLELGTDDLRQVDIIRAE